MFLSLREIRSTKGRIALMASVVGLITVLLVMLTGLTGGLAKQNTSALEALDPQSVGFSTQEPSFTESSFTQSQVRGIEGAALGVGQTKAEVHGKAAAVAVMGLPAGESIPQSDATIAADTVALPESLAQDLGVGVGGTLGVGADSFQVGAIVPDLQYSHLPVAWVSTQTWRDMTHQAPDAVGTVLLNPANADSAQVHEASLRESFAGLPAYSSEQGSLRTMQGFLYAISGLVTVAFLAVWTLQRTRDIAILKALGAARRFVLSDALVQAALVLATGVGLGALGGLALGAAAAQAVPFELSVLSVVGPALGIWALGMLAALISTRIANNVDPLLALGGNA